MSHPVSSTTVSMSHNHAFPYETSAKYDAKMVLQIIHCREDTTD